VRGADTVGQASRGYDVGKKVKGRKRFIVTDSLGLLLVVTVLGYWPAGTAAFHVNADIAAAVIGYLDATDDGFERSIGLELLVETARLWGSLGHHDAAGRFRIDGVTGPDEYSAVADNNIYTNLMAQQNLRAAADLAARHPDRARDLQAGGQTSRSGAGHAPRPDAFTPSRRPPTPDDDTWSCTANTVPGHPVVRSAAVLTSFMELPVHAGPLRASCTGRGMELPAPLAGGGPGLPSIGNLIGWKLADHVRCPEPTFEGC
jgi:Glycosyl hydrolase family 65 central catalytic domain